MLSRAHPLRLLLLEDSEADALLLEQELRRHGFDPRIERVQTEAALREALDRPWDVVLCDYSLPGFGALHALAIVKMRVPDLPVILVSGSVGETPLVEAMRAGASDYVLKDNLSRLAPAIRRELRDAEANQERRAAERLRREAERERERAEAALRDAQQRLQHVVSSSPAVLYSLRPEGHRLLANWVSENIEGLLGFTVAEALGQDWWASHIHPDDWERVLEELPALFFEDRLAQEYRFQRKDGGYQWLRAELRLLRDAAGVAVEVVGSWSDITARKEAELRVEESERQYRLLFDSNPHPMWVYDVETLAFLAVNDAAVRHYGWSRDEFLGMTIRDLSPPGEIPKGLEAASKHRKKDGGVVDVEGGVSPIVFQGRRAWLALATDVTERRSLEAQLLQSQKMESVGRLAGGVAHDFNNLIGVITGYGELLRRRLPDDPRLKKYADDILKAANRAADLTRQLLAFSRQQVLRPRILDLNAVVAETEKMLRRLIGEDIELVTLLEDGLGPVRADTGQIGQVLMNLAVNARDAMPLGGRLTIETSNALLDETYARQHAGVEPGRYVRLTVSDTGHGMPPEVQARIFEPFFTTKEPGRGTGLGLATAHGIVKQSHGHVFVRSEPGQGTAFEIYLPRVDAGEVEAEPAPHAEVDLPRGSETVVLVEDETSLRALIRESLEAAGYSVLEARHGAEALEICERHPSPVQLLMTDVVMPGMAGRELAERVRALQPEIRVLYISGYTDDAMLVHGVLAEDMAFLQKPFTPMTLARKVRELLDRPPGEARSPRATAPS